jgi:LytB protein
MVVDYIVNGGDKTAFLKHFENAVSKGFDPDTMLDKVGLANQTTMYKKETRAIGQLFQKAMMQKFGPVDAKNHYMEFDTICDATQVRKKVKISCAFVFCTVCYILVPFCSHICRITYICRSDKMQFTSWWKMPRILVWTLSWWWVALIRPTRPTCWRSPTRREFVPFTLTVPNVLEPTIPLRTGRWMVKLSRNPFWRIYRKTWSWESPLVRRRQMRPSRIP